MKNSTTFFKTAVLSILLMTAGCKKDKTTGTTTDPGTTTPGASSASYVLVIDNGAQSMDVGQSITLSAHLVNASGTVVNASGVTWKSDIGTISGNAFSCNAESVGGVTATVQYDGGTYTSVIPVNVVGLKSTRVFGVVPSAIIWATNAGDIQLNTVYVGTESSSFTFASDNNDIASVSSSGNVSFKAVGSTNIKVTGVIGGKSTIFTVPVLIVGTPAVPLPVTRIAVTPAVSELFKGDKQQFTAKAYNSAGDDVTNKVTFTYAIEVKKEEDDGDPTIPVEVSSTGEVTAKAIGSAYLKVTADGVTGQSEIVVNPDTVIMITPFQLNLGTDYSQLPPVTNTSGQLTAKTYKIDHAKYKAHDQSAFVQIPNSPALQWDLPVSGIPQIDDVFKVVTLKNKTSTTVDVEQIAGKVGATFVIAHAGTYGGAASINVNP